MKSFGMLSLILVLALGASADALLKFDFPIYKNKPAGKQVGGNREATTTPALSPVEAQRQFTVPEGFEVRLFAAEPMVVNPVTMTWDERGRLWVLELYEYPSGAPEGTKGRDRIKILEDTDADGVADKVHVWADGMSLATGLILGDGGAYVGQAPHLLHLKDTDGDDRADSREIVMTGFGLEDRHELLNGFTWGPDGYLYMTHGVFTHSKVKNPDDPDDDGVIMNAAVARFHPRTKKFEVFADGTSNPWGVDFDAKGNAFVSACVIDHLFHLAPGGLYSRQAGQATNPHAYELLPSIVDHRHHMAAYSGVQVYLGDKYPEEYIGKVMMGNIHDNAVHADKLTPKGSSFVAAEWKDFLRSDGDGWFRPVSEQVGPDGNLWIADWHDKYPCYQNARADPEGVDREYGRIWRVVYTGGKENQTAPSRNIVDMNLATLSSGVLSQLLGHKTSGTARPLNVC
jgi:putative membrane-bound dehydrogenase-like protein